MSQARGLMFGRMARYYDLLYGRKEYRKEALLLEKLARRFGHSGGNTWLDVACGTGRHLEFLARHHAVVGLDRSPEMLKIARRRLPRTPLRRGDMRSFDLGRQFDVVTCLFSAIGHLRSERELERAFANFARHTKPGGVVIVEPWIDPSEFLAEHVHVVSYTSPKLIVVRVSSSSRSANRSIIQYGYQIAELGRKIRTFEETDRGVLVPRARLLRAMRRAGLTPRFLPGGLSTGRGLLVAVKPRVKGAAN